MQLRLTFTIVLIALFASVLFVGFGSGSILTSDSSSLQILPEPAEPQTYTYNLTLLGQVYQITATTNSSVSNFGWIQHGIGVQFEATTPVGSSGYCDFTVPEVLLGSNLALLVDGVNLLKDVNYTQRLDGENYVFHITFGEGTRTVEVKASTVTSSPSSSSPSATPDSSENVALLSPKVESVVFAGAVAVGSVAAASAVMSAVRPAESSAGRYFEKMKEPLPDSGRKYASDLVESKRKLKVKEKKSSHLLPTRNEAVAYAVGIVVLTFCYGFGKVGFDWAGFLEAAPIILLTFMIVEFVKIYAVTALVRARGVWAEHKTWPLGLILLGVTTLAFRMPLSSPTRSVRHGPKASKRLEALVASAESVINLAFTGLFFAIFFIGESTGNIGLLQLAGTGLPFCAMMSFFEILPIPPMGSKEIWDHNKKLWAGLFALASFVFVAWILLL